MKTTIFCLVLLFSVSSAFAQADFDGILSLRPAGENSCVAVEISTPPDSPLLGLRWLHNDSQSIFPRVVLMEGEPGVPPDLDNAALILVDVSGASLDWGEIDFGGPVTSSTETAYAVFYFPAGEQTEHVGEGGGPGLGVREAENGAPFYLSGDGEHWSRYASTHELSLDAVRGGLMKGTGGSVRVLSEMDGQVLEQGAEEPPTPSRTALEVPSPNPFNPRVTLSYTLAKPSRVALVIYDVKGRVIRTLVSSQQDAGAHSIVWPGNDHNGRQVASGIYFARFSADGVQQTHRMVLVR